MILDLRPYQHDAIGRVRVTIRSGVSHLVMQLPTGAGKTIIAAAIFHGAYRKGNPALFIVPSIELIDQTVDRFRAVGLTDIGVIQQQHPLTNPAAALQIASVQTLARRDMPPAAVVIIDEVHQFYRPYAEWLRGPWASVPVIGLSATPWTRGLGKHFGELVVGVTMRELIDQGYLSPFRVYAPSDPNLRGVRTQRGDFVVGDLAGAMSKPDLIGDVVETWLRLGEDRPTFCYGVNRAHAALLAHRFAEAGVAVDYIDGETPSDERKAIQRRFESGATRVVCNVGVLAVGIDWDVRALIVARPTWSEALHVQIIGRGLRTAPGKTDCIIMDHAGNHHRLGFVDAIRHDRLDDGEPRASRGGDGVGGELVRECPTCSRVLPIRTPQCPNCGEMLSGPQPVEAEGELVPIGGNRRATPSEDARLLAELHGLAVLEQRPERWVRGIYKGITGEWPPKGPLPSPLSPAPGTRARVREAQLAFARKASARNQDAAARAAAG